MIEPGEVYIADFAEAGPHPVIVVSREALNRGRYSLVVVCTSADEILGYDEKGAFR